MIGVGIVLVLSGMSVFIPGVPAGTTIAMVAAGVVGLGAARFHGAAERHVLVDSAVSLTLTRLGRLLDDAALALCVLALLYAVDPL